MKKASVIVIFCLRFIFPEFKIYPGFPPATAATAATTLYYGELIVEGEAAVNISNYLVFSAYPMKLNESISIESINITTDCTIYGSILSCRCMPGFIWRGPMCQTQQQCCSLQSTCNFSTSDTPSCLPKNTVTMVGSLTLNENFVTDYDNPTSPVYQNTSKAIIQKLTAVFSNMNGFECVNFTGFRRGSVIADFTVYVSGYLNTSQLQTLVSQAGSSLNGIIAIITTGFVSMKIPNTPLKYNSTGTLVCSIESDFDISKWEISIDQNVREILTGSECTVSSTSNSTTLNLLRANQAWRGNYTCTFTKGLIIHKASAFIDIALLPDKINMTVTPSYPDCSGPSSVNFNVNCSIQESTENYTVTWNSDGSVYNTSSSQGQIYGLQQNISCNGTSTPLVTCTFRNRLGDTIPQSINVPVIYKSDKKCPVSPPCPEGKDNTNTVVSCDTGKVGQKTCNCANGNWKVVDNCVNQELQNILDTVLDFKKGIGNPEQMAGQLLQKFTNVTMTTSSINSAADISASVKFLETLTTTAQNANASFGSGVFKLFINSTSNILNTNLTGSWKSTQDSNQSVTLLQSLETFTKMIYLENDTITSSFPNIDLKGYRVKVNPVNLTFDEVNVTVSIQPTNAQVITIKYNTMGSFLPINNSNVNVNSVVQTTTILNASEVKTIDMRFLLKNKYRRKNKLVCVFWDFITEGWSTEGCQIITSSSTTVNCSCSHTTSFSVLMSGEPVDLPFLNEITYVGLGISICSLIVCLAIESLVWSSVVKSNISHFRHTALVNIAFSLLIGDCCFVAATFHDKITNALCLALTLVQHFAYLSMFFWMLCQSMMLLHQIIFLFHQLRKKIYMAISFLLGYGAPVTIVAVSYGMYNNQYYRTDICWLKYKDDLTGSIFTFAIPAGSIVIINIFSLFVVIAKILRPAVSDSTKSNDKETIKGILKAIIILTPTFGLTWGLGFFTMAYDISSNIEYKIANYAFTILNSLQGLFILLCGICTEKKVRETLLKLVNSMYAQTTTSESTTNLKATSSFSDK
ncbi:adhesion G protein-coupled receptor F5-like [Polypterus senegalus]|uniref:adhesion G protein-coupled receptor F5-like n=1 Tax=Polypterus senegalus TaxID=55291 RepID=UPI001963B08F|nr:adhesion G protein-coupled receptor F5-like [Polypterus senegalus]XP_039604921.1 adhesion G protein-coupled receptor F5-like [Polypterus senegalus]